MTKYYKQVKDGLYGEVGHVYIGDDNIVVPPGFVGCLNEMVPVSYHVVFPEHMVRRIDESEYEAIEQADYVDDQPKENPRVLQAKKTLATLKQTANELSEIWFELSHHEVELAGLNDNYPLEKSFDEYDFNEWGESTKRTPIEEAVMFLDYSTNNGKYTTMLKSEMNEMELFKAVVKGLSIRKSRAQTLEEEEEIDRLIENL